MTDWLAFCVAFVTHIMVRFLSPPPSYCERCCSRACGTEIALPLTALESIAPSTTPIAVLTTLKPERSVNDEIESLWAFEVARPRVSSAKGLNHALVCVFARSWYIVPSHWGPSLSSHADLETSPQLKRTETVPEPESLCEDCLRTRKLHPTFASDWVLFSWWNDALAWENYKRIGSEWLL